MRSTKYRVGEYARVEQRFGDFISNLLVGMSDALGKEAAVKSLASLPT
jgi:hypothetical protein